MINRKGDNINKHKYKLEFNSKYNIQKHKQKRYYGSKNPKRYSSKTIIKIA